MRFPSRPALPAAAATLALLLACGAKGVKETRDASKLAVRELQGLVDEGIERGLKEREAARSEEALDFAAISAAAVQRFTALPEARALKNPYSAGRPVFMAGPEGREPGTIYLDATSAASGAILVTAVFQDGAAVKREAASVKVNVAARPKKIDVDTGAMPAAPGL